MKNGFRLCSLCLLMLGALAASEHHGMVKFEGLPVPGVTVRVTLGGKSRTTTTDQRGIYSFPDLADGLWALQIDMLCFESIKREIVVAPNAPSPRWELQVLPPDQLAAIAAPVAGSAVPGVAARETPSAPLAKAKESAPAAAAKPTAAYQRLNVSPVDPGAKPPADAIPGSPDELSAAPSDGFLINGSVNNSANSAFAQSTAFGNNRRPGRSLYNGNLGFTLDNSNLDARSYSITGKETPGSAYDRLTGLLSFGGPLPLVHTPSRPNFTFNYQWLRNAGIVTVPGLMPTPAQRAADFSAQTAAIYDPLDHLPFPDNRIPESRISRQASALLALYPLSNFAGTRYNYQIPTTSSTHQDALQTRLNQALGTKNQINGSLSMLRNRGAHSNLFSFQDKARQSTLTTMVTLVHRFSQAAFMTLGAQYSRSAARTTPFFAYRENVSAEAGIDGSNQEPANWGPPALAFGSGLTGLSDGQYAFSRSQTSGVSADMYWSRAPHNVRLGLDLKRLQYNQLAQQNPRGEFAFTGNATQRLSCPSEGAAVSGLCTPVAGTGSDFAGFLLGVPDTLSIAYGNADKYFRSRAVGAYMNDDFRVSSGLTLNYGLRWEYASPVTELYGRLVNLDVAPGFAAAAPVVAAGAVGPLTGALYPGSLVRPDRHGFAPRVGFAWHPMATSSVVVRGGYGISFDTSVYTAIATQMAQQSPFSKSLNMQGGGLTLSNSFNATPSNIPNTFAIDPDFRVGSAQTWQLSVQRNMPASLVITGIYMGIKGTHVRQFSLPNTVPIGAGNNCPECPIGFQYEMSGGNSTRQSAQLQVRRRLRAGFAAAANYTFSKSIDDAALGGRGQGSTTIAQNWLNIAADRGLSNFDQRHLFDVQMQYSTGAGMAGLVGGWKGRLLKEWTFVSNIHAGTGLPLTPVLFATLGRTGCTGCIRPDYTGLPLYGGPSGLNLNPAAFEAPEPGRWGNAGRNIITGPAQFGLNASLGRTIPWGERRSLDVRFDASNVLNHVTFPSWNTIAGNAQFGLPGAANAMRVIQTTVRVRF